MDPVPSWPLPPNPQQYAAPAVVTAQLCKLPAEIAVKFSPPATATGNERLVSEPLPSWPERLAPQQVVKVMPPATGTGLTRLMVDPSPSWPEKLPPQHDAVPDAVSRQVCAEPATIAGRIVVVGPVESPQALDIAAMRAMDATTTRRRIGTAKLVSLCNSRDPRHEGWRRR